MVKTSVCVWKGVGGRVGGIDKEMTELNNITNVIVLKFDLFLSPHPPNKEKLAVLLLIKLGLLCKFSVVMCHLNKGEVNDKRQCAAINCVYTVLGTVAHAVVATITSNDLWFTTCSQLGQNIFLVLFPVQ